MTRAAVPEWLRPFVVREVTGDPAFSNEALATAPAAAEADAAVEAVPAPS
jgi:siroheme synthase